MLRTLHHSNFYSNMDTSKGTQEEFRNNESGATEIKVETVDYRSPPGENQQPRKENVEIIHQIQDEGGPGVIGKGVAAVAHAVESAKKTVVGTKSDTTK
uniref:Uncharacterized protein n=1 Tax=Kalanchoe fedtschenkoi TaxID=63787 RepID=A0A7N0ZU95_KALFE